MIQLDQVREDDNDQFEVMKQELKRERERESEHEDEDEDDKDNQVQKVNNEKLKSNAEQQIIVNGDIDLV
jgi:hypothetical protein